jgi:hypothetical protein
MPGRPIIAFGGLAELDPWRNAFKLATDGRMVTACFLISQAGSLYAAKSLADVIGGVAMAGSSTTSR